MGQSWLEPFLIFEVYFGVWSNEEVTMKKLSCRDLGGPCDAEFNGESFEEIGKKSHAHVMEQMQKGDEAHLAAASSMRTATPEQQKAMMAGFKMKFDQAPNV
jgi:predicted small metal-binding protein